MCLLSLGEKIKKQEKKNQPTALCSVCHVSPKRCWDVPCVLSHLQHPQGISYPVVHHVWTWKDKSEHGVCLSPFFSERQGKGRKGKGKNNIKCEQASDARWAETKSCCNSLSTNIFLLSMAGEKKMTFNKSTWFSLSNNRPAENCFEGRSYPEQQLQTELDLLWDSTTARVWSFSLSLLPVRVSSLFCCLRGLCHLRECRTVLHN